ncbi:MAG: sulfurtransferase TusA family protein [Thaumarchaeota archaeon]|nr:sulfurtransferase TusA family protein [Nitrososphaerota archaeon]
MRSSNVAKTLDARGVLCPIPVLKAKQTISQVGVGSVLEILATDPAAKEDISAWARRAGHQLLSMQEENGVMKFYVKRGV